MYQGQFNAQTLTNWTSQWGGGSWPHQHHGTALITPGMSVRMTPGGPYDTFYQLQRMAAVPWAKTATYHVAYKVADADLPACQALEGEIQRNDGSMILNGGFQFDLKGSKRFRTYDFVAGQWVQTAISCDDSLLAGGHLLDVVVVYDFTPSTITYRGVQINGLWAQLDITRPGKPASEHPYLNYATQWDFTAHNQVATMLNPCIDINVT